MTGKPRRRRRTRVNIGGLPLFFAKKSLAHQARRRARLMPQAARNRPFNPYEQRSSHTSAFSRFRRGMTPKGAGTPVADWQTGAETGFIKDVS
jgi:hypothetical protein